MAFQEPDNLRFEGIEFAGRRPRFARAKVVLGQPVSHRTAIQRDFVRDLGGVQALVVMQVFDLTEAVIVNHFNTSQRRANTCPEGGCQGLFTIFQASLRPLHPLSR
jgi:hypothetical protein